MSRLPARSLFRAPSSASRTRAVRRMLATTAQVQQLVITRPDDWHLHVRDGGACAEPLPHLLIAPCREPLLDLNATIEAEPLVVRRRCPDALTSSLLSSSDGAAAAALPIRRPQVRGASHRSRLQTRRHHAEPHAPRHQRRAGLAPPAPDVPEPINNHHPHHHATSPQHHPFLMILQPPMPHHQQAQSYKQRILAAVPAESSSFTPLMTCYLTDNTTPEDVGPHRSSTSLPLPLALHVPSPPSVTRPPPGKQMPRRRLHQGCPCPVCWSAGGRRKGVRGRCFQALSRWSHHQQRLRRHELRQGRPGPQGHRPGPPHPAPPFPPPTSTPHTALPCPQPQ